MLTKSRFCMNFFSLRLWFKEKESCFYFRWKMQFNCLTVLNSYVLTRIHVDARIFSWYRLSKPSFSKIFCCCFFLQNALYTHSSWLQTVNTMIALHLRIKMKNTAKFYTIVREWRKMKKNMHSCCTQFTWEYGTNHAI